jgi:hypothetical protein
MVRFIRSIAIRDKIGKIERGIKKKYNREKRERIIWRDNRRRDNAG